LLVIEHRLAQIGVDKFKRSLANPEDFSPFVSNFHDRIVLEAEPRMSEGGMQVAAFGFDSLVGVILYVERRTVRKPGR
jgi:hypothetical protein